MATPAPLTYTARIGLIDHAGRTSRMLFHCSAADFAAWVTDTTAGNVRTLMNALEAMSLDNITEEAVTEKAAVSGSGTPPSNENAVNSAKLLVLYTDTTTGEKYSLQIPARFAGNFTSQGGQVILSGAGATTQVTTLVTQLQTTAKSEDGNAITIRQIRVVGRGTAA